MQQRQQRDQTNSKKQQQLQQGQQQSNNSRTAATEAAAEAAAASAEATTTTATPTTNKSSCCSGVDRASTSAQNGSDIISSHAILKPRSREKHVHHASELGGTCFPWESKLSVRMRKRKTLYEML
eukprot:TRINITY_DN15771_c1_g1_i1.p1 TRINITY_DN15771_c1_g1~~TRINITY_DN15771_c1_g1_i1.p1  ORF type:complete len:125 (+),score=33.24 TRINITY_DN15771_c1_g1_i1:228-602(+)